MSEMRRVAVLPWPEMANCYLVVSGAKRRTALVGERWYDGHAEHKNMYQDDEFRTEPCVTFTYSEGGVAAEWDGAAGPIQLWFQYEEGNDEARPHWLWPHATGTGHWSQLAVDNAQLPRAFNAGNWTAIFSELRSWVKSRLEKGT